MPRAKPEALQFQTPISAGTGSDQRSMHGLRIPDARIPIGEWDNLRLIACVEAGSAWELALLHALNVLTCSVQFIAQR